MVETKYTIDVPLNETGIVGSTMMPYCSSDNSYWVHKIDEGILLAHVNNISTIIIGNACYCQHNVGENLRFLNEYLM